MPLEDLTKEAKEKKICSICLSEGMSFQRRIKKFIYCIALHDAEYRDKEKTLLAMNGSVINVNRCSYKI